MNPNQLIRTALALICAGVIAAVGSCNADERPLRESGVRPEGSADASRLVRPTAIASFAKLDKLQIGVPPTHVNC